MERAGERSGNPEILGGEIWDVIQDEHVVYVNRHDHRARNLRHRWRVPIGKHPNSGSNYASSPAKVKVKADQVVEAPLVKEAYGGAWSDKGEAGPCKTIEGPAAFQGQKLKLSLGLIDDFWRKALMKEPLFLSYSLCLFVAEFP